jgi:ADP-heptose:LPS heptosyltransferase
MADPERILVVKLADIGDLLTITPALRALRLRYPTAEITALVTPHTAPLLEGNDAVDATILFPKGTFDDRRALVRPDALWRAGRLARELWTGRFDAVVLFHHLITTWGTTKYRGLLAAIRAPVRVGLDTGRSPFLTHHAQDRGFGARHEVEYWLDVAACLGAANPDPGVELHLRPDELTAADARWAGLGLAGREVVAVHPGSGAFSLARRWPADRFAAVADALAQDGLAVVLIAGPGEERLVDEMRVAMRATSVILDDLATPRDLAATLRHSRLFVGNDSGVMHLAATMGVPTVGVFGLTNHRAWGPYPPELHRVVRLDLPCSPCVHHAFSLGMPQGCPARMCLNELEPAQVVAVARELLTARAAGLPTTSGGERVG